MSKQEARAQRINEWLEHLRRWKASGGSLAAYAKEHGVALWALYHWRGVLIQEGRWEPARTPKVKRAASRLEAMPLQFARVAVSEAPMAPYIVRLQLGNGRRAEIELRQVEPLLQLIAAMERQP
ncbi:hypothetical protein JM946_17295 [Steroidobacter sp. S1-65]|uniref:Transposase n=1 Tax=Steroidobacter gossypii TaxID=2805490 RepID=A0ABS1WZW3_9GAMM|nr:hypothetical protein [Steroidobacter gossypii]MBM0106487.1 hypothetical protein [Steroidobacter gossypii]